MESLDSLQQIFPSKSMKLFPKVFIDSNISNKIGNYILDTELGRGAFGKVVLGKHIITGEKVAIKILNKIILRQTPDDYELVKKEMSILKLVKHKYIVQLYEILQTPSHIFIIMEYCEGKDFMDYILSQNYLNESEALKYFQQLINALFYLHSQSIAHRDIKIDNILLDRNNNLKLIDFGLSTKYSYNKLLDQPCGTIVYSAPEVLECKLYHGMLADIWSCGIVLYGMLCGYLPFCEDDDNINKKNIIEGNIEYPKNISSSVKDLLKHMLDINPMNRYTLQDIKEHPWFKSNNFFLIQGIIIGYHQIPVDDDVLDLCQNFGYDKNNVKNSVINNKYDEGSALYYLIVKQRSKKGIYSKSDLFSEKFIKYIYDDENLIEKNNNKIKKGTKNEINDIIRKTKSNLNAAPVSSVEIISTPKKNNKKIKVEILEKYNENKNGKSQNASKQKIMKKNKRIKLFSTINKKSLSKIQKYNNFSLEKNNIFNTSNLNHKNKIKNKITKNEYCQLVKKNNSKNRKNKNFHKNQVNHSSEKYAQFFKSKIVIKPIYKNVKLSKNKENKNIVNNNSNKNSKRYPLKPLSLKDIFVNNLKDINYHMVSHSQITRKSKYRISSHFKPIQKSYEKVEKFKNKKTKKENVNNNIIKNSKIYREYSSLNGIKMSKSIDTIDFNVKMKINTKIDENENKQYLHQYKNKFEIDIKNIKNITPLHKISKSNINYLSHFTSATNSKEKRNLIGIKNQKLRFEKNEGYSTNYTNYTKSSSNSSNTINKNKKRISSNFFIQNNNNNNSHFIYINNSRPYNLKKNIDFKHDAPCPLILDNLNKNKNDNFSYIFPQKVHKTNNIYKTEHNNINIKLIKKKKIEKLKKVSKYQYINNKSIKLMKILNQNENINHSKNVYNKINKDSNNVIYLKKHNSKINNEKFFDLKIKIEKKNSGNISIIKVNKRPTSSGKNLTSPNHYKIKQRISLDQNSLLIKKNSNERNNFNKKRHFESTVITRRYNKSPFIIRELSESQSKKIKKRKEKINIKYKELKNNETEKTTYIKYMNKIKVNPFIKDVSKINISKIKKFRNKMHLKIDSKTHFNNQNNYSLNYNNDKSEINHSNQMNISNLKTNYYNSPYLHHEQNNRSINFIEIRTNPIFSVVNNKSQHQFNKKIYHRNLNHFNISNTNTTNNTNYTNYTNI